MSVVKNTNLTTILNILREHKQELIQKFAVKKIGVYGSFVRGEEKLESDVDIYIEFDINKITFDKYYELSEYLESIIGRKVDIITKDGVETIRIPYIKEEIKRSIIYV
ncbi:nucleotidyltransferase family protein [Thermosipho ferrireducens]|uniref:Nucleotidyltransferase family protein n=1 Tax=Thermosipho ferrireducens TaxID=2571116 RepID=A0ABX7S733_9BACT|nr:nucleotidyltransferase family protein [Thermosipho ferrireducens]QTA38389.1 nucleotidyltransferase family protein [Thermosipho ferrireducens]